MSALLINLLARRRQYWRAAHEQLDLEIAQQYGVYHDDTVVATLDVRGILQMFLFAPDDVTHVEQLLAFCDFPQHAHVLDCGCGTGDMDVLIHHQRPDLQCTLLNKSMWQLRCCPAYDRVVGDMQMLPFADASFDGMLLCYTLGYGTIDHVFSEAARVVRPGGSFVLSDMECVGANQDTGAEAPLLLFGYKCYGASRIDEAAATYGFCWVRSAFPACLHPMVQPFWTMHERQMIFHDVCARVTLFQRRQGGVALQ